MPDRFVRYARAVTAILLVALASAPALAQGTATSSLSGMVIDADGVGVSGATVTVSNDATGVTADAFTNGSGRFSFPELNPGTYTVTVSLIGFKTWVTSDVRLLAARPASVTAALDIGEMSETVRVRSTSDLLQSLDPAVASTLLPEQLTRLPRLSRNTLYDLAWLPGVSTTGGPGAALINGLPNNAVNITIDGAVTGNIVDSTNGFSSFITPGRDAVQQVTLTGAVPGMTAGPGSTQVSFVTRSGSNRLTSSAYLYWRDPTLNSNAFFNDVANLPKNDLTQSTYGARLGGPLKRGTAFFFLNMERDDWTTSVTRDRTVLTDAAASGLFAYDRVVGGVTTRQTVDLLALAGANGQIAAMDPTVASLLGRIRSATGSQGTIRASGNPNTNAYTFQPEGHLDRYAPTGRLDINLASSQRLTATYYWQRIKSSAAFGDNAEVRFPGFANSASQAYDRTAVSVALRSALGTNKVNQLTAGWMRAPYEVGANVTSSMFEDQGGYNLGLPLITGATALAGLSAQKTTTWNVRDELDWLAGSHNLTFGASFAGITHSMTRADSAPTVNLGFDAVNDPAASLFTTTNFPGASSETLAEARDLYGLLTGRVISIDGTARLDTSTGRYVYLGGLTQTARQYSGAAYVSDLWRVTRNLTFTGGVRWDVQFPFTAVTSTFSTATLDDLCGESGVGIGPGDRPCNQLQPGTLTGKAQPQYQQYSPGTRAYNTNYTDIGYHVGFAWRPHADGGFWRSLFGDPEVGTIRAGYSKTFNHERIDRFMNTIGTNPGGTLAVNRNATNGYCLVCAGESWPILLSQTNRLGAPAFPASPAYPINSSPAYDISLFQPDLRTPRVQSWSAGLQRSLGPDTVLEMRWVANRYQHGWTLEDWNERNIFENGFYDEFLLARANLAANIAGGMGNTFAYTGLPGTAPLPIHQAYLSGLGGADVTNPASYTSPTYRDTAFLSRLSIHRPDLLGAAAALDTTAFRQNALAAGNPVNFFVMNPAANRANVVSDRQASRYSALQVDLRRRLAKGLMVTANYTHGVTHALLQQTIRFDAIEINATGVPDEFKASWIWELPIGRGRSFGGGMHPVVDALFGNWELSGNARVQSQRYVMSNVKLEGMTEAELSSEFRIRKYRDPVTGTTTVFSLPADIIRNTRAAFSTDPTTANGYSAALGAPSGRYIRPASDASCVAVYRGDCGAQDIAINGPLFTRVDLRLRKSFPFLGRGSLEVNLEMLNAFNSVNFTHALTPRDTADAFQVTSAYRDPISTQDPGGRIGQVVFRVSWQ